MRTHFTQSITPTVIELGTITRRDGREYSVQKLRYGTHHHVYVWRKGCLNMKGGIFTSEREYEAWKQEVQQHLLFGNG